MPKCDQIADNGVPLGPGHVFNRLVVAARHRLGLSAPNGVKRIKVVDIFPSRKREGRVSMLDGAPLATYAKPDRGF